MNTILFRLCKQKTTSILFFVLLSFQAISQDIQFSQFYAVSQYVNPAFAGSKHNHRVMFHNRYQWPSLEAKFTTYFASYDTYFSKYQTGFGVMVINDQVGINSGNFSNTEVHLQASYELHLNSKYTFRAGVQAGYATRSLGYNDLRFPSKFNDKQGFDEFANSVSIQTQRKSFADIAAGGILYSDRFWVSFAGHHLNEPNQSNILDSKSFLPAKFSIATGYKFPIKGSDNGLLQDGQKDISFTPTINLKHQNASDQLDIGAYFMYDKFVTGVWYRGIPIKQYNATLSNNESIIPMLGIHHNGFIFGYSYDIIISKLAIASPGGAHEFNISYLFDKINKSSKKRPMKRIPCPDFYQNNKNLDFKNTGK